MVGLLQTQMPTNMQISSGGIGADSTGNIRTVVYHAARLAKR